VACALGCAPETLSYEGEAACRLEALAVRCPGVAHPLTLPLHEGRLDLARFWPQLLDWQAGPQARAGGFYHAPAPRPAQLMRHHADAHGIRTLCFSGGAIHNRLLRARLNVYLHDFTLLFPRRLPAGDGAIAFGQAAIAAARLL